MKNSTSIRISQLGKELLSRLANKFGISRSLVIEIAIRKLAEQENIQLEGKEEARR